MNEYLNQIAHEFKSIPPDVDFWTLRLTDNTEEQICVRQGVLQPVNHVSSRGILLTVVTGHGSGYAATSDLSAQGLKKTISHACMWAKEASKLALLKNPDYPRPQLKAQYKSPVKQPWNSLSVKDKITLLQDASTALKINDSVVDWQAFLGYRCEDTLLISSADAHIEQQFHYIMPGLYVVANKGTQTQYRSGGGLQSARQGGLEQLPLLGFPQSAPQLAEEACALLSAPECPQGTMDIVLAPSQMILQIHESIGHPLELDRILGDERNYAGTSFVTEDMFGNYRYGSDILNVTFDPNHTEQLASYAYDDEGSPAKREYIIQNGILQRPLGGATSQARAGMQGVANARQADWFRPPIDRMANLNVEPGDKSAAEIISSTERGVYMETNRSWSIDDSRNKFQFGCELGRIIENGELKGLIRNPNYRGISATFWRSLTDVGNTDSFQVQGVTNCGKGEPNQAIYVGHASPTCRFSNIDVFGGTE
ncbi:TldD family protein, Beta/Gamma-proteobacterial subgroup [hydrothermal vent metagenome]|uniref:TldD family protein, Beta/Gamma-proteobacterial subgroup n=1 Tax=hydrothermal vent metagenome TaxID=652676 RepID=A0A3B0XMP2_9ZZZZ